MPKLIDLLLPTPCVICGKLGSALCLNCREALKPKVTSINVSGVTGVAFYEYDKDIALIVNSVKEKGVTSLIPLLVDLVKHSIPKEFHGSLFVPISSSPKNNKKRGFSHSALLAKAFRRRVPGSAFRELLRSSRGRADQVGLSPVQRQSNLKDAFKADLRGFRISDRQIILVDDVITSGATMASAIAALRLVGLEVAGFLAFARAGTISQVFTGEEAP